MKDEAQRIAIAEACGLEVITKPNPENPKAWQAGYFTDEAARTRRLNWKSSAVVKTVPDYLTDLNAMHEAEKVLTGGSNSDYGFNLAEVLGIPEARSEWDTDTLQWIATATARQRAEAFLRTLNLWIEEAGQ